ncbi:MAG: endonuclease V [Lachnospiraceae bacterium]|nr:endonuclease V [Lachnospiraceae bacterium]
MENRLNMESRFIREQEKLLSSIQLKNEVNINELQYVAGVDVAYWKEIDVEYAVCCIVVIDYQSQEVIERQCYKGRVNVPYIPGCLAFREIDIVLKTTELLKHDIELYVFDGNGYLHPRHMGLATHAGILLNKPSIGIAKSYFKVANVDYSEPDNEDFAYQNIMINNEVYGRVVRTHKDVKPIFLSIGNKIDIDTATNIIMRLVTKDSHIPIPTRYADIMTHEMRKKYQEK